MRLVVGGQPRKTGAWHPTLTDAMLLPQIHCHGGTVLSRKVRLASQRSANLSCTAPQAN